MNGQDFIQHIQFNGDGLVPAIAQDAEDGEILMMAWMNAESIAATMESGEAVYWSRSRGKLWHKGEQSGNTQLVESIQLDCDGDTIVLKVRQKGGVACHTGRRSCFYLTLKDGQWTENSEVITDPAELYGSDK